MTTRNYGFLDNAEKVEKLTSKLIEAGKTFGFDIESGYEGANASGLSLQTFHPRWKMVGFSFTNDESWARYIPLGHDNAENIDPVLAARAIWKLLQTGLGVAHNAAFELNALSRWFRDVLSDDEEVGAEVREAKGLFPIFSDSMIEAWMVAEYEPLRVGIGLKGLTKHVFGHEQRELKTFFTGRTAAGNLRFNVLDLTTEVVDYACEDAVWCLMLHKKHYPKVKDNLMFKTEIMLLPVLARMEIEGLELDWAEYERRATDTKAFKDMMNEQIQSELGERLGEVLNINLGSPKQVAELLYERLGLPIKVRTDTGAASTSEGALRAIAAKDPAVKSILQWREVGALHSRYIEKYLKELRYADDGRAHPRHKQTGALTGRFSVDHVSYQQWPKPYHYELTNGVTYDLNYRDFLIAPKGFRIVGYDFSQVELRILAGMSEETDLLQAFADGTDIHTATASLMMGIPVEKITKKQRAVGKALADSEVLLTPSGWMRMGDVKVGDEIVIPSGGISAVEAVFPQGEREIYRVQFEDGSVVRADGDHLWPVNTIKTHEEFLLTTTQILEKGLVYNTGKGAGTPKWYVKNVEPLEFEGPSDLPIDPYLLGLLLGDGSLSAPAVSIAIGSEDDKELSDYIREALPEAVILRGIAGGHVFTSATAGAYRNPLDRDLKELGLRGSKTQFKGRFGLRSWEKHVPQSYLFGGVEQRYALLRGLMDADGTVGGTGRASLTTTSEQLAQDVIFLARSLGGRAKISRSRNTKFSYLGEQKTGRLSYEVFISTPEVPFKLARKVDRWKRLNAAKKARLQHKKIVSIVPDGVEHATCIRVADESHEFITAGVTRTHNTLNFAIVYGSGAQNIADLLGISKEESEGYLEKYFTAFPKLKGWMDDRVKEGSENGFVSTKFGRKFTVWEYVAATDYLNRGDQQMAKFFYSKGDRMTVNAPVQGGAADYMKLGMVRVAKAIKKAGMQDKIRLVMTIHDALEFYVADDVTTQEVVDLIQPAVSFPVPGLPEIRADWHEGFKWGTVFEAKLDENKKIVGYEMSVELPDKSEHHFEADTFKAAYDLYIDWEAKRAEQPEIVVVEEKVPLEYGDSGTLPEETGYEDKTDDEIQSIMAGEFTPAEGLRLEAEHRGLISKVPSRMRKGSLMSSKEEIVVEDEEPVWAHATPSPTATLHLTLSQMPTPKEWSSFLELVAAKSGNDTIIVHTPSGDKTLASKVSFVPDDTEKISHILSGAKLDRVIDSTPSEAE